jgi:acetate kinase
MNKKILVFNAGSSSLKFKLFEIDNSEFKLIKKGMVDNIGKSGGPKNHKDALALLFQGFGFGEPSLAKIENLTAIGHRVVHGGDEFNKPTLLNREIVNELKNYNLIAPLHNPKIIEVIEDTLAHSGQKGHRDIPNYAIFDSSYFNDLPLVAKLYPLPYEYYTEHKIKRFGFHGISHKYAVKTVEKLHPNAKKIISIHLGAGCSMTAIKDGAPIDTSMGFTPLEGLMMGTRSGDIDAGIIHYLIEKKITKHNNVDQVLNFESGLLGISGIDSDMRELLHIVGYKIEDKEYSVHAHVKYLEKEKIERAKLAIDMFVYRIKKYIGAYTAILGGCDVLVFTGRMATGSSVIRKLIVKDMEETISNSVIEVIESDEEQQIAEDILKIIGE